jgi:hypothetical protein
VDEVRVDDVGPQPAQFATQPPRQRRVEVARTREAHPLDVELAVERLRVARRVVQPDEERLDSVRAQSGEQGEQVPLGPADPADAMDVDDPHRVDHLGTHRCRIVTRKCQALRAK